MAELTKRQERKLRAENKRQKYGGLIAITYLDLLKDFRVSFNKPNFYTTLNFTTDEIISVEFSLSKTNELFKREIPECIEVIIKTLISDEPQEASIIRESSRIAEEKIQKFIEDIDKNFEEKRK